MKRTLIILFILLTTVHAGYGSDIKIGVLTNRGYETSKQMWEPTAEYLSKKLPGYTFRIIPLSFDGITSSVQNGEVDFLITNPSFYVDFEVTCGISRIATLKNIYSKDYPLFGGVIFTRSNNPKIYKLRDLIGKKFMAVAPNSFGGWLVALREFRHGGIDPYKDFASLKFSKNHESAIYSVLEGKADAGTANTDVFADLLQKGKIKIEDFRIIVPEWINTNKDEFPYPLSTRLYPNWSFSKLRKTPEDLSTKVAIALLSINSDDKAARAAHSRGWSYPLNYQSVHELEKQLKVGGYKDFGKLTISNILQKYKVEFYSVLFIFFILSTASIVLTYLYSNTKRAKEALRLSEEKFSKAFRSVPSGLTISNLSDGKYIDVNDAYLHNTGYSREEIIGHRATELNIWVEPDKRVEKIRRLQENGGRLANHEVNFRTKAGHILTMLWSAELLEISGEKYLIAISQDITELRKAQEELRKSEEWYRTIADFTYNWEYWIDNDINFLYVSPSCKRITGYSPDDFLKDKEFLNKIVHPDDLHILQDHFHRISSIGEVVPIEFRIITAGGQERWIGHICQPVFDNKGGSLGRRASNRDITDRKEVEKDREKLQSQLLQAQKMEAIGQLAAGLAHDFNNLLSAMMGYCGLIKMNIKEGEPTRHYAEQIISLTEKGACLTQNLLVFGRKQMLNPKPTKLNEIIQKASKLLLRLIREDIELKISLAEEEIIIFVDGGQIEQVLINLATNARDSMPKGGLLTIKTELAEINKDFIKTHGFGTPGLYGIITVEDTGLGMDEKTKEKIFEPFFTTKETGKGTGLGLSMAYGIITQHNGFIRVYSEVGKGTTFKIYLPAIKEEAEQMEEEKDVPLIGGDETVLLAEDNPEVREGIRILLEKFGYKVIEAENGEDAVSRYIENKDKVRLVIIDVIMPKKTGKEAYHEMQKINPDIKALFTSGYTADIINMQYILEEGLEFISKPVSPKELLRKMREILK